MTDTYRGRRARETTATTAMPAAPDLLGALAKSVAPHAHAIGPAALTSGAKRAFDLVAASVLLVVASPIWLVAAALVRLSSPGPVLFRQERLGVGGEPFTLLKFRTMHHGVSDDAHRIFVTSMIVGSVATDVSDAEPVFKLSRDRRITRLGRFLRTSSLDEIPQLINVLRGEMSLVGPRPPLRYEVEHYEPWQLERLTVRPGITGLWQVSGRNRLTYNEMCKLDIRYINTWSLGRDLLIVAKTPWAMLVDRGGAS